MKKNIVFLLFFILISTMCAFCNNIDFTGRWAEEISERVVADIIPDKNQDEYKIFITWREDNLSQKDIYRFSAKYKNGILVYKNGTHIYRNYDLKGNFEDKLDYNNGFGSFKLSNDKLIWIDNKDNQKTTFIKANKNLVKDTTIKNRFFSITLPQELKGLYEAKTKKDMILLYHKASKKAGFGGFAFGLKLYKDPSNHATSPGTVKIGEFIDKKNNLYDMVLIHPTDVQYDYTKSSKAPDDFALLYDYGDIADIKAIKGNYYKNQGMKGKDLYNEVLKKHLNAIKEKWNSTKLEQEDMSYMYNIVSNPLNKIGYAFYDSNKDGIDELFIGEITQGSQKGVVYDIYTMVDRNPEHVISGGTRNRFFACDNSFICNEYSSGAKENGVRVFALLENSTELFPQVGFKYDAYKNPKNPWFISYNFLEEEWNNVPKKVYDDRKQVFNQYKRFNFTPLKDFK